MSSNSDSKFVHLQIAASIAAIVAPCIAVIALIPAFEQWLDTRESTIVGESPTAIVDSTPPDLPLISQVTPETPTATPMPDPTQTPTNTPPPNVVTPSHTPTPSPTPGPNVPFVEA